jgi:hypothetical protein
LENKIIITGTGRAGTTFLVHLLTLCGVDTGFKKENADIFIDNKSFGGLESSSHDPYVLKSPHFCDKIEDLNSKYFIDYVIIPIRSLEKAASSRIRVGNSNGGYWEATSQVGQEIVLLENFYKAIHSCAKLNIDVILIDFDVIMSEKDVLFVTLRKPFPKLDYNTFIKSYDEIFDKRKITQ